jgi:hypothetical protein
MYIQQVGEKVPGNNRPAFSDTEYKFKISPCEWIRSCYKCYLFVVYKSTFGEM